MLTIKGSGVQYNAPYTQEMFDHADETNLTLAIVTRPLTYDKDGEYVDDITEAEVLGVDVYHAKQYLDDTQHKFGSDYELKEGEDLTPIILKRSEFRAFIRANVGEIPDEIEVDEIPDEPVA